MRSSIVLLALATLTLVCPISASAHGREPSVGLLTFDANDPDHLLMRTTWTLLESHDGGASWVWRCANAVGYERTTEDPPVLIAGDGTVMAGIFNGLVQSTDEGCRYVPNTDPDVDHLYVIDLVADPSDPHGAFGITSPGDHPNTVVHSADDGASWELRGTPDASVLLERVRVAPSDAERVYTSGAIPARGGDPRRALFFRSSDGGRSFESTEIPLQGEERNLHVLAVDPTNPDRVLMRVVRLVTDTVPERLLLSEDGGLTWETAASLLEITGLVFSEDGSQVWVGGWDGAFLRSDTGGSAGSFMPVAGQELLRVRCLNHRDGELWICVDDIRYDYAVGRSSDGGSTIEHVWGFEDATVETGCSVCSPVGGICPMYWPDVVFDLGLPDPVPSPDAGPVCDAGSGADAGPLPDGSVSMDAGSAEPPSGCACAVRGRSPVPFSLGVGLIALVASLARRRGQPRGSETRPKKRTAPVR